MVVGREGSAWMMFGFNRRSCIDSFADRLSWRYTVWILCLVAIASRLKAFISHPSDCFSPAQFSAAHHDYTLQVKSTKKVQQINRLNSPN